LLNIDTALSELIQASAAAATLAARLDAAHEQIAHLGSTLTEQLSSGP
jgi:hypothetical protein